MQQLNFEMQWYTMILENGYEVFTNDVSQQNIEKVNIRFRSKVISIVAS